MNLTRYEQETIISFNAEESTASIYTADPVWIRKLEKISCQEGTEFKLVEEIPNGDKTLSVTYEFPKKLVSLRSKSVKLNLTDEQRAAMSERMKKLRESQLNGGNGYEMQRN